MACPEVVPTLLVLLTKQDEDAGDEDYNVSRAAYQCLQLFAQAVGPEVVQHVLPFVEGNLRDTDWHKRDAAVSAFGAIMEGPEPTTLEPLVKQALPVLLEKIGDDNVHVRDSAAYAVGRICDLVPGAIDPDTQLPSLIEALFSGLSSNPKMASSCCWALMSVADQFAGTPGAQKNPLSPHFEGSVSALLSVTEKYAATVLPTFEQELTFTELMLIANFESLLMRFLTRLSRMLLMIAFPSWADYLTLFFRGSKVQSQCSNKSSAWRIKWFLRKCRLV